LLYFWFRTMAHDVGQLHVFGFDKTYILQLWTNKWAIILNIWVGGLFWWSIVSVLYALI
jgi:hypothetical protein